MRCLCGNEINIGIGAKIVAKGCKILTAMTVIVTVQCDKCRTIMQVPIKSDNSIFKMNKEN